MSAATLVKPVFPKRLDTVLAAVAASFAAGETLTPGYGLKEFSTMRLAHQVYTLREDFNWPIVTDDRIVECRDGRTQTVAAYSLPSEFIDSIDQAEREAFISSVFQARAELRNGGCQ